VTEGNIVTGGSGVQGTLLTIITKVDPIYCYVDADERSVLKYQRLAQEKKRVSAREQQIPCYLQLANEPGFPHEGMIDFVDNHVDPNTGTLRARGVFPNADGWLLPGLFGRMRIPGSGRYQAVLVPDSAIDTNQSLKQVRIVRADNVVEVRAVTLGSLFGQFRAIESGLTANERIVINGIQRAIPGSKVDPKEEPLDTKGLVFTSAPGSPATQSLPATRHLPPVTQPATAPVAGGTAK
jgi:RND family efflux transporter MFP subunit